ncbi:efflux transporter outer membrane subunit [Burkholderia cenocepacia]|uniref:efflux transporter outer membrane subunit n=1 Tax=Burkholderia cenocepacia TaxID=95486 RepID=UPI001588CF48|nr:efflux transporter outer membrane subunit [Burkholderia cenocepacia]MBR8154835.1 efflux transporter outer membrane subunit [Burkholderia cenocepacia]MCA8082435.1 efflux transporter outer membrane subunit [Burkholderia cenocepacia]HEB3529215.1 efflux transporter outer membrane subunit [Burkholderia cenocepacia]
MKRTLIALVCTGVLAGCTLDPTYQRPAAPVDDTWSTVPALAQPKAAQSTAAAPLGADLGWRDFFKDPRLQKLIELALANNRDMRVAALNVAQYEAQYRIARANVGPAINASGSVTRERVAGSTSAYSSSSASVGLTSWEIDFFGRLRSLKRQALEQYLATDAARTSTQISLIATVATDYLQLLSDETSLQIAQNTVDADQHTYDLTVSMMKMGSASLQDVRQAENSLASARSSLASYTRAVAQDRNNLVAEIGAPLPDDLPQGPSLMESANTFADIGEGVPSDLLTRRPDIVEAEHTLKAANANIGAARAAFFPKIELTASAGTTSGSLSNLFKAGTGAWTFAPSISVPIFDFGYNRDTLDVAKVEKDIDIANYEKAIQTAFKEVSNALAGRTTYITQVAADRDYVSSAQQYYDLAQARYRSGTDSFLTLLDAQRTLYAAQQQLVTDMLAKQSNLITLYKVLGGGWRETSSVAQR